MVKYAYILIVPDQQVSDKSLLPAVCTTQKKYWLTKSSFLIRLQIS